MTSFLCAEGGPIWIKFRGVVQNDMSTAVRCGNGSEMYNSNMADVWANSMACYRGATYDIAGFCHKFGEFTVTTPEPNATLQGAVT